MLSKNVGILFINAHTGYKIDTSSLGTVGQDFINISNIASFAIPVTIEGKHPYIKTFPETYIIKDIEPSKVCQSSPMRVRILKPCIDLPKETYLPTYIDRIAELRSRETAPILCSNSTDEEVYLGSLSFWAEGKSVHLMLKKGENVIYARELS